MNDSARTASIPLFLACILHLLSVTTVQCATLKLEDCIEAAYTHLQYQQAAQAYERSSELAVKNAGKSWLPEISLDGSFSHQNENVTIPVKLPIPGLTIPNAPLNFSRLLLHFSQTIYDGSLAASRKKLERSRYESHQLQLEIDRIHTKSRVISLYISIQLTDENLKILANRRQVIGERQDALVKAADYGGATVANIRSLDAELLMIEQNIIEAQHTRATLLGSLGEMIGRDLPATQDLQRPDPTIIRSHDVDARPEIRLMDSQVENLELQKSVLSANRRPRLSAFASIGAGSPGYDIFKDDIATMGIIGAQLQWRIFDWSLSRNEKDILAASQTIVRAERFRTEIRLRVELEQHEKEIDMLETLLEKDDELIQLRAEIARIRAAEFENGILTSTDYISELNLEEEARLNQKVHELRLILAKLNYLTLQGNF